MINKLIGTKNTSMCYQKLCIETKENSLLAYDDFLSLCEDIIYIIDSVDTLNPFNTYNINSFTANLKVETADNPEYLIDISFKFSIENDYKTEYCFETTITDVDDIEDEIIEGILTMTDTESSAELPRIIVTEVNIIIDVTEE